MTDKSREACDRAVAALTRVATARAGMPCTCDEAVLILALRAALDVAEAQGWQTMDSAPRDGSRIIGYYCADGGYYDILWDDSEGWVSFDYEIRNFMQPDFTHWTPLPAPPAKDAGE